MERKKKKIENLTLECCNCGWTKGIIVKMSMYETHYSDGSICDTGEGSGECEICGLRYSRRVTRHKLFEETDFTKAAIVHLPPVCYKDNRKNPKRKK